MPLSHRDTVTATTLARRISRQTSTKDKLESIFEAGRRVQGGDYTKDDLREVLSAILTGLRSVEVVSERPKNDSRWWDLAEKLGEMGVKVVFGLVFDAVTGGVSGVVRHAKKAAKKAAKKTGAKKAGKKAAKKAGKKAAKKTV